MERNMELFEEIENKIEELTSSDKIELMIEFIEIMQDKEMEKAFKSYNKKQSFYNNDLHIAQENYNKLENIWNLLQELYILD